MKNTDFGSVAVVEPNAVDGKEYIGIQANMHRYTLLSNSIYITIA